MSPPNPEALHESCTNVSAEAVSVCAIRVMLMRWVFPSKYGYVVLNVAP